MHLRYPYFFAYPHCIAAKQISKDIGIARKHLFAGKVILDKFVVTAFLQ